MQFSLQTYKKKLKKTLLLSEKIDPTNIQKVDQNVRIDEDL